MGIEYDTRTMDKKRGMDYEIQSKPLGRGRLCDSGWRTRLQWSWAFYMGLVSVGRSSESVLDETDTGIMETFLVMSALMGFIGVIFALAMWWANY